MNIEQLISECDNLASRYYRLDSGSRERAARDWLEQVKKTAEIIKKQNETNRKFFR
jgi:hypothetical protein